MTRGTRQYIISCLQGLAVTPEHLFFPPSLPPSLPFLISHLSVSSSLLCDHVSEQHGRSRRHRAPRVADHGGHVHQQTSRAASQDHGNLVQPLFTSVLSRLPASRQFHDVMAAGHEHLRPCREVH